MGAKMGVNDTRNGRTLVAICRFCLDLRSVPVGTADAVGAGLAHDLRTEETHGQNFLPAPELPVGATIVQVGLYERVSECWG